MEKARIEEEQMLGLFLSMDVNGDTSIHFSEFLGATIEYILEGKVSEHAIHDAFKRMDQAQTGSINRNDLQKMFGMSYNHADKIMSEMRADELDYRHFRQMFRRSSWCDETPPRNNKTLQLKMAESGSAKVQEESRPRLTDVPSIDYLVWQAKKLAECRQDRSNVFAMVEGLPEDGEAKHPLTPKSRRGTRASSGGQLSPAEQTLFHDCKTSHSKDYQPEYNRSPRERGGHHDLSLMDILVGDLERTRTANER